MAKKTANVAKALNLLFTEFTAEWTGRAFNVHGQEVLICNDGRLRDAKDRSIIIDNNIRREAERLAAEDAAEVARRENTAKILSYGNEDLAKVLRANMDLCDGILQDCRFVEGVPMWYVGRNAGGFFYAGVTADERKMMRYTSDGEESVYEVPEFTYFGHR